MRYPKLHIFTVLLALGIVQASAQTGVGTISPDASSALDISSSSKGLLIPRMNTAQRIAITTPASGLMLFDSSLNQFYYYNGATWNAMPAATNVWGTSGNSGTSSATNFIGTTDAQALQVKVNNAKSGFIDYLASPGNTSLGYQTLASINTGTSNVAVGYQALMANTNAGFNTAVGYQALKTQSFASSTFSNNTAIGYRALANNQPTNNGDGANNVAVGQSAMVSNTNGYENTAVGSNALMTGTSMRSNTAVGLNALRFSTASFNVGIGCNTLNNNTTGTQNVGVGDSCLVLNLTASNNTAVGSRAMVVNRYASNNTVLGTNALRTQSYTNGNIAWATDNTALGYQALAGNQPSSNTNGYRNTAVGSKTLATNITGSSNTALGYGADVAADNLTNATAIGAGASVSASNSIVLGNNANVGIGIAAPTRKLEVIGTTKTDSLLATNILTVTMNATDIAATNFAADNISGTSIAGSAITTGTFAMSNGAANGYLLQSDAGGNGNWVDPTTAVVAAGTGLSYTGNTLNSVWTKTGNNIANNNAGNIGIGTGPSAPAAKLDVAGTVKIGTTGSVLSSIVTGTATTYSLAFSGGQTNVETYLFNNAVVGSAVMVSPATTLPAGMVIAYSWIPSNGVLAVAYQNTSAGANSIPSGIPLSVAAIK